MPRRAPLLPLLALLFPITLDAQFPIAAPEKRIALIGPGAAAVASNGQDFFSVWNGWGISGNRIGLDGTDLSDGGEPISSTGRYERNADVVWNGSQYVVIHDQLGAAVFTRVLSDHIGSRKELPVSYGLFGRIRFAWNGNRYLVVRGAEGNYAGASLTTFLATSEFEVAVPEVKLSFGFLPSVSSDGSDFLVAWLLDQGNYSTELRIAVVSNEGVVRNAGTIATFRRNETLAPTAPSLVWNGTNYLVVWSDAASIRARHVDPDGNPGAETITIARSQGVEVTAPDVAWNGSMYLVTFSYRNEWATPMSAPGTNLYASRMSVDGTLIDSPYPLIISTAPSGDEDSSVAAAGSTFLVVWGNQSLYSATVDAATGAVGPHQLMARTLWEQSRADGVFDGSNFAFMWQETTARSPDEPMIMFGRVTPDGRHLDGSGVQIGTAWPGRIAVAAGGYLVTWWRNGEYPVGVRITRAGEMLDSEPVAFSSSEGVLGTDGESFLHIGTIGLRSENGLFWASTLRAQTLGISGAPSSSKQIIPPGEFHQVPVGLAWNGSRYLLLYQQYLGRDDCHRCFPSRELRMVMLDRNGDPISDSVPLGIDRNGFVAAGSGRFLIARGTQLENDYIVVDEFGTVISSGRLDFEPIDVEWDGAMFNIAGYTIEFTNGAEKSDGYILRVEPGGSVVSETRLKGIEEPRAWELIPAGGAMALLYAHDAGILRYQFSWLEQRRRAVAR